MAKKKHADRAHAKLSASGSHRWMNCTPSALLESEFGEDVRSIFADEGTLAHELSEAVIRKATGEHTEQQAEEIIAVIQANELYNDEMPLEVQKYVDLVLERYAEAKKSDECAVLLIEQKFDFSHIVPEGFGTGDACIIANGVLEIIDLKYGKGVMVEAKENPQLKLYGLGAVETYDMVYTFDTVRLTIIQPRLDHIVSWDTSLNDLMAWGNDIVKPKAELAIEGKGIQKAGDWCRFCKVKARCATLAAESTRLARMEFKDPHLLTDEQLMQVYHQKDRLVDWANAVDEYVLKQAIEGKTWEGLKLVAGKSNRKWSNEEAVKSLLTEKGFPTDKFINSKLAGIGDVEKLVGKDLFPLLLTPFIIKPEGKPTLAPIEDKRPAFDSGAKNEFNDSL